MKITLSVLLLIALGYVIARFLPGPGNMIGLPGA